MVALPGNDATAATAAVGRVLNDPDRPMKERFRALFTLRNIGGEEAVNHVRLRSRSPVRVLVGHVPQIVTVTYDLCAK